MVKDPNSKFFIDQNDPYLDDLQSISKSESLQAILKLMEEQDCDQLSGETKIFAYPGYKFRIVEGLSTNFHQPDSTLILLVAAFVGEDWRKIYDSALANDYRFLSYGDTSLLLP